MDSIYIDDVVLNSDLYQNFILSNPGIGNLKIRAYAANEAIPIVGLHIIVSTLIQNQKVIFFDGYTDTSGMIEKLSLPAPKLDLDNLNIPEAITYEIDATMGNDESFYDVKMYDGICVLQNINFVPGGNYGNSISSGS